jgi:hypothetical protein
MESLTNWVLPIIIIVGAVVYYSKKISSKIFTGNNLSSLPSLIPSKIGDGTKKIIVSVTVYLVLLVLIRELQPDMWNWVWERDKLFWLIQITFISIALVFALGPTWTKWLLFPALIIVLATHVISEIDKDSSETEIRKSAEEGLVFKPLPYTNEELYNFLDYQLAPANLRKYERRGEIKKLHKVFSEKVNAVNWSSPVVLSTPPSEKILYKLETVVLSGQVLIKNYDTVVGKYPDKGFEILNGKKFSLRFKSLDHLETAVVVWMWEEHLP